MSADKILETLKDIQATSFDNEADRVRVRDALFDTLRKVQSPWDIAWEHNWVNGATNASIKALIEADVLPKLVDNDSSPKTSEELAKLTGADPVLLRMLPCCVSALMLPVPRPFDIC